MNSLDCRSWRPIVDARLKTRVSEIVHDVCLRFKVEEPIVSRNDPAEGPAGIALACAQMDRCFPGEGWKDVARRYLLNAFSHQAAQEPLGLGLFTGLTGVAWSVLYVAGGDSDGQKTLMRLDELLVKYVEALAKIPAESVSEVPSQVYDIISGVAGISFYLLERKDEPGIPAVLERVYDFLIWLTSPSQSEGHSQSPPRLVPREAGVSDWPKGVWDLGLAHGLPGVLAALAKGTMSGVQNPRLKGVVRRLSQWLMSQSQHDDWGITWPAALPRSSALHSNLPPARTAWCYGPPGVARALWLAAQSLQDLEIRQVAIQAMEACCQRPRDAWRTTESTFCHGLSGIAQILLRFFHDTGISKFSELANVLVRDICNEYERNRYWIRGEPGEPYRCCPLSGGRDGLCRLGLSKINPVTRHSVCLSGRLFASRFERGYCDVLVEELLGCGQHCTIPRCATICSD